MKVSVWQLNEPDMTIEAVYTSTSNGGLAPLAFTVRGSGEWEYILDMMCYNTLNCRLICGDVKTRWGIV